MSNLAEAQIRAIMALLEEYMSRLNAIDPSTATGKSKELLDAVKANLGLVPNMTKVTVNSPAVLEG